MTAENLRTSAWAATLTATAISVLAWWQGYGSAGSISSYQLFPLFGLIAFTLMWGHYIAGALRRYWNLEKPVLAQYFSVTAWVVLLCIILHPAIFTWQLYQDGLGLPPKSFFEYGGTALMVPIVLGETALLVFLAYEFHRKYGQRQWWRYVSYASDVAMVMIFIHALRLGGQLQEGWFRYTWFFYGATLAASIIYTRFIFKQRTD